MPQSNILGNINLSWTIFTIVIIVAIVILFAFSGYIYYMYHLGKPMEKFFLGRMKSFMNKNLAIFEIFGLTNNVTLEYAHREVGDGYKLGEYEYKPNNIKIEKKRGRITRFFSRIKSIIIKNEKKEIEIIAHKDEHLIMPKSTYTTNGLKIIPLLDLYPKLHKDILKGLDLLKEARINSLLEFELNFVDNLEKCDNIFFENYTYKTWHGLYKSTQNKYEVELTVSDITNFVEKNFDKNFRESIKAKEFNSNQHKKNNDAYKKYMYASVVLCVIVVAIRGLYVTFYR